jgi:resuscitation-promoting factor RpfB
MRSRESRPLPGAPASRPPLWVGLLVVLLIGTLGFTWLSSERAVTLVLDGEAAAVRSHATTVGELLARSGVDVGPDDVVRPAPDTLLADGMVVEHVRAREITLLIGDIEEQVLVTALSVDEVLADLGFAAPRRGTVRPSRSTPVRSGMVVELDLDLDLEQPREPVALTVIADGAVREVITDEDDVGELLERLAIDVGPSDRVIPGPAHPTEAGIVVTVQRVTTAVETRREPIPHSTQERRTDALPRGERREVRGGVDGIREITEEVVRVDGAVESRAVQGDRVLRDPQDAVVEVGTAAPPAQPAPAEPAPAQPAPAPAPSPSPAPAAEAESPGNVEEGGASWYDNPYGGMTAAHKTIPRGTFVKVTNLANGKSVTVRINDRGPYVEGRIIDLNREAFAAIGSVSRGLAQVRIEW